MTKEGALKLKAQRTAEVLKIMEWDSDMVPELYALYDRIWDENGNRKPPQPQPPAQPLPSVQVLVDALEKIMADQPLGGYDNSYHKLKNIAREVVSKFHSEELGRDGWVKISEHGNPPEQVNTNYLLYSETTKTMYYGWVDMAGRFFNAAGKQLFDISHYQLPAPPKP